MWLNGCRTIVALAAGGAVILAQNAVRADSLETRLNGLLASPLVKGASISLDVVEITARGPVSLYSENGATPLGPASNCKLLTTAAAFERYGPTASFKTQLYKVGDDLLLVGGGDPGLGDAKLTGESGSAPTAAFQTWAGRLKQMGLSEYRNLIVDDRIFDTQFIHPHWPADQRLDWYCAPVGGLNFNANCLDWSPKLTTRGVELELLPDTTYVSILNKATRGAQTKISLIRPPENNKFELRGTLAASSTGNYSVPIYDPGMWTGTILRDILAQNGITATGVIRRAGPTEQFGTGSLLATHETPILAVLKRANTHSLNMMAEALCKRLGYDSQPGGESGAGTGGGQPGSWASGTAAVRAYIAGLGAKPEWVSLDDGSGLSNQNRASAKAFTTVLAHIAGRPDGQLFLDTLAVPGEEGTLEKRFKSMPVGEHVRGKTGHISGVSALSGYIIVENKVEGRIGDRRFAFSILVNKYQGNVNPWQDSVCQAIYEWAGGK